MAESPDLVGYPHQTFWPGIPKTTAYSASGGHLWPFIHLSYLGGDSSRLLSKTRTIRSLRSTQTKLPRSQFPGIHKQRRRSCCDASEFKSDRRPRQGRTSSLSVQVNA